MKVLHFIWSANFGGIEKLVIDLTEQQQFNSGLHSEILIGCNKGQYLHLIKEKNIKHHQANIKSGWQISINLINVLSRLMSEFDIIHIHTFNLPVILGAIKSKKKIVYTIHGNFNYGKKIKITDRINNILKSYFLNNKVSYITFNSNWSKQEAVRKYNLNLKQPNKIISNGIFNNGSKYTYEEMDLNKGFNNKFLVGTIARLNKSKKIERLIDAYSKFSKDKNDVGLVIIGDGVERTRLNDRVRIQGIENQTLFTGYIENIKPYAEKLNLCVFPFQYEAFGLVVLESFSLGKPVIIFNDNGGMQEILSDKFKSDIVNSVDELVERMEFYYLNKNHEDNLQSDERKQIASLYSIQKMERNFFNCYTDLFHL